MSSLTETAGRYGAIAVGLMIGTAAKYGVQINDGETPTWAKFGADVLMLGLLGAIAVGISDLLAIRDQNGRVLAGAIAALLSARLIKMVRDKALARASQEIDRYLGSRPTIRQVYEEPVDQTVPPDMQDKLDKLG